jgi:hypothetical protein
MAAPEEVTSVVVPDFTCEPLEQADKATHAKKASNHKM